MAWCTLSASAAFGLQLASARPATEEAKGGSLGRALEKEGPVSHAFDLFETHGEMLVLLFSGTLMLAFVFGNFLHKNHISVLPESLVVIGLGVGMACMEGVLPDIPWMTITEDSVLNRKLLGMVLLPIIIFEAGFNMKNREFLSQLPYILIFAIFGTVICMGVVAVLIVQTSHYHGINDYRVAFVYGALISAVDPVATLATYAHLNVEPLLSTMVMGESIVNDAVAIVLFNVLNDKPDTYFEQGVSFDMNLDIAYGVVTLLGGSVGLGLVFGMCYVCVLRFAQMAHSPAMEILFIFFSCFFSYAFAEHVCSMSGIITVLFQGMIMGAFATPHLTVEGKLLCAFLLKQMATVADMVVFSFVGIGLTFTTSHGLYFGLFVMFACLVGRATAVVPLGLLTNVIKSHTERKIHASNRYKLSWRHLFMMWHAGLRGGIAVVLVLSLGPWVDDDTKELLRNATLLLVCAFLLVFGGTTELFLRWLGIPIGDPPPMTLRKGCFYSLVTWFEKVLTPILVGSRGTEKQMPGGIVKHILSEAESEVPVRMRSQQENENVEHLFGVNPLHRRIGFNSWLRQRGRDVSAAFTHITSGRGGSTTSTSEDDDEEDDMEGEDM
eukprot:TRINITY_DN3465_c0_g1_i1.p1 TRINITY_DN3465_c0_g1~~TRINITY_DN3465_c0_g1_i1.p1  ORF type:complete len:609 (+),score=119.25 TRINITY_DN3465_c0_g1_i1:43-1869(+)